ncbi:DUF433 domain-containing protein [Candidatus Poribacteria bacterium]|nr:DUF433 domain-containing protein [Candidatus Poribacteria bacterium]
MEKYKGSETKSRESGLVREMVNGESYEYYPIGKYIVSSPEVCRGRPTFKYTRIEVVHLLELLAAGVSLKRIRNGYEERIPRAAVEEALMLAGQALLDQTAPLRANL